MENLIVDISPGGNVEALNTDAFDLGFLGHKQISRASMIIFEEDSQTWYLEIPGHSSVDAPSIRGFAGYEQARNFEVIWLQSCRENSVKPMSADGISIASTMRVTNRG